MNTEHLLRLQALCLVQAADISSVLAVVQSMESALKAQGVDVPDVKNQFLKRRVELLHEQLEEIETTMPALAAQLQKLIDDSSDHYPFDY